MGCIHALKALVIVVSFSPLLLHAQTAPVVGGGDARGSTGTASFTIGQTANAAVSTPVSGSVSEGVQQPYTVRVIAGENDKEINVWISAYPNPATTVINVKITHENRIGYSCQLLDAGGRIIMRQEVKDAVTTLPLDQTASGAYIVQVMQGTNLVKSFNIIKKQ